MVPIWELRGGIPLGHFAFGIPIWQCVIICIIGNLIPVPIIYLFARKVLEWGKDKKYIGGFFTWCYEKGEKGGEKLNAKEGKGIFIALVLFIGIPLPGTGAWTGTLAASFLDMGLKKSFLAAVCGVLIASVIVTLACLGVLGAVGGLFAKY
jgi:uncharacterized membrane protein